MAKPILSTNYKDDILNVSTEGKRKYRMNYNDDGTVSFVDVTPYDQEGSDYGAGDINLANEAVNQSADAGKIIDDPDTAEATTEEGYIAGVQLFNHVNDSLQDIFKLLENVSMPLIPSLASDIGENGVASTDSSFGSGYEAFRAFDGIPSTIWSSANAQAVAYIQYEFNEPHRINEIEHSPRPDTTAQIPPNIEVLLKINGQWVSHMSVKPETTASSQKIKLPSPVSNVQGVRLVCTGSNVYSFSEIQVYGF